MEMDMMFQGPEAVAKALVADGKGILAADETVGTLTRRFEKLKIPSTPETRRDYRELLFTAPGASEFISGVIMYDETIRQCGSSGTPLPDTLAQQEIIPGIKVDTGAKALAGPEGGLAGARSGDQRRSGKLMLVSSHAFRALVDAGETAAQSLPVGDGDWLQRLYDRYGLKSDGSYWGLSVVTDHLRDRIRSRLRSERGWTQRDVGLLERQLIFEHVVDGRALEPFLSVLQNIRDAVRNSLPVIPFENSEPWREAIQAACEEIHLEPHLRETHERMTRSLFARDFAVAEAIKFLKSEGFKIAFAAGQVVAEEAELRRLASEIINRVKTFGGREFAARILFSSRSLFDAEQRRYHFVRQMSLPTRTPAPAFPYGYVLNLCAAFPEGSPLALPESERRRQFQEIQKLSVALTTLLDVQPYNIFEQMFHGPESILQFLRERVVFDSTFSITQLRPTDVVPILKGLFHWVDEKRMREACGWSLQDALSVIGAIVRTCGSVHGPCVSDAQHALPSLTGLPSWKLEKILGTFVHEAPVNQGYELPADVERLTFQKRPLLRLPGGAYLIMDISWCAPAFIEAVTAAVESVGFKDFYQKLGDAAETFVKEMLKAHNALSCAGHYDQNGEQSDCDSVVETETHVFLGEAKKKPLRPLARRGDLATLLRDLAESLLESQRQIGAHEIRLRKFGSLTLSDSRTEYVLALRGREVERVSISLFDFASLQDRSLLFQLFGSMLRVDFEPKSVLGKLPSLQQKLRDQQIELNSLGSAYAKRPFFNAWFISIPQLLILLDRVNSPEDFKTELWRIRHVETGSGDFYCELARSRSAVK